MNIKYNKQISACLMIFISCLVLIAVSNQPAFSSDEDKMDLFNAQEAFSSEAQIDEFMDAFVTAISRSENSSPAQKEARIQSIEEERRILKESFLTGDPIASTNAPMEFDVVNDPEDIGTLFAEQGIDLAEQGIDANTVVGELLAQTADESSSTSVNLDDMSMVVIPIWKIILPIVVVILAIMILFFARRRR